MLVKIKWQELDKETADLDNHVYAVAGCAVLHETSDKHLLALWRNAFRQLVKRTPYRALVTAGDSLAALYRHRPLMAQAVADEWTELFYNEAESSPPLALHLAGKLAARLVCELTTPLTAGEASTLQHFIYAAKTEILALKLAYPELSPSNAVQPNTVRPCVCLPA